MKTKKSLFLIACLIISSMFFGYSERKNCQGIASLVPMHQYVMLYDSPSGNIIDSIINDTMINYFLKVCIEQIQNGYAQISALKESGLMERTGWIQLKYLGINPANTSCVLRLYAHPDKKSIVIGCIPMPQWGDLYPILQCKDDWLYIRAFKDGVWREGWLSPEDQCDNPYSTCG